MMFLNLVLLFVEYPSVSRTLCKTGQFSAMSWTFKKETIPSAISLLVSMYVVLAEAVVSLVASFGMRFVDVKR